MILLSMYLKMQIMYQNSKGEIAQLVEQAAHIRSVRGPSPFLATKPYHSW